jgi:drug/metabolite transporter (DMT)-like permease
VLAVSAASIFIRFAQQAGANSLVIAAFRLTIAALVLLPFALTRCWHEYRALSLRDLAAAALSGVFLGGHFATWILSLSLTSVVSSVVLVSLGPLFVALASAVFLKERIARHAWLGMLMATSGGTLIALTGSSASDTAQNPLLGNMLALVGAVCLAPYLIIGRALRKKLSLLAYITLVYGAAAVLLLVLVFARIPVTFVNPIALIWIGLLALIPQLIGHTTFNWAVRHMPAAFATIPVLAEPIGTSILAMVLFREVPGLLTLVGAIVALAGIAVMSLNRSDV